jgi:hypothetical protein
MPNCTHALMLPDLTCRRSSITIRARASECEDLKKFEDMHTVYDTVVKEKAEVEEIECVKLQRF